MSFWPFGQSLNNSNINRILDDYFKVLHTLEKTNPAVAKSVYQNFNGEDGLTIDNASRDEISVMNLNESNGGGSNEPDLGEGTNDESLTSNDVQRFPNTRGSSFDSASSKTRGSSFNSSSDSSRTDSDETDINAATEPITLTIKSLNSSYIDKLLDESELLNELTRQNSTLLDFICFGFFYDSNTNAKVQNIEYLLDQMLECIDNINPLNPEPNNTFEAFLNAKQGDSSTNKYEGENLARNVVQNKPNNLISESNPMAESELSDENDNKFVENAGTNSDSGKPSYLSKATIISEIFSLDIWLISESLVKNQSYLSKIWSLINHPKLDSEKSPLVPIFLKINQNLLMTRQDQYLNSLRSRTSLVDEMLNHMKISMIMDFFLKCLATDKVEAPSGMIELVHDQELIPKCLAFLNNDLYPPDIQACAGDFLKALIAISANAPLDDMSIGPNSLTRQLVSPEIIDKMVYNIIHQRGSALNITVSIVIELIRKNNSDYDQVNLLTTTIQSHPPSNRDPIYLGYMLKKFSEELSGLFQIILDADTCGVDELRENQLREKYKPLGFERFKVVELIAELLHCSNMGLMNSKKAERINRERDNCRKELAIHLQDALEEFTIDEGSNSNGDQLTDPAKSSISIPKDSSREEPDKSNKRTKLNINDNHDEIYDDDKHDDDDKLDDDRHNDDKPYDNKYNNDATQSGERQEDEVAKNDTDLPTQNDRNSSRDDNSLSNDETSDEEMDESFEIPYVNESQSAKLRKNSTIGDLFKIKVYDTQILPKIIDLFLTHPWNNFWHNVIFDIIQQIFNGRMDFSYNSFLVYSLFNLKGSFRFMSKEHGDSNEKDFGLTKDLILKGYKNSYEFYEKKHTNLGYMGHLVLIAEEVVKFSKLYKVELISPDIYENLKDEEWVFYAENVLNDTRLMYSKILGGGNYVDDGNGNIIPQIDDATDQESPQDGAEGGDLINVEALEEQLGLSTESDLHEKLRALLIHNSQQEVEAKNKKNGVIILGPPPEDKVDVVPNEPSET